MSIGKLGTAAALTPERGNRYRRAYPAKHSGGQKKAARGQCIASGRYIYRTLPYDARPMAGYMACRLLRGQEVSDAENVPRTSEHSYKTRSRRVEDFRDDAEGDTAFL